MEEIKTTSTVELDRREDEIQFASDEFTYSMGPQHPSSWGTLRLQITLDGERVRAVDPDIGYLHRGIEKSCERRTVREILPLADRVDFLAPLHCEGAVCRAVEQLAGIEVPPRGRRLRALLWEVNRIASHLFWWGLYGWDLGAETPVFYANREREKLLDLFEKLTGSRTMPNFIRPGGLAGDLPGGWLRELEEFLDQLPAKLREFHDLMSNNSIFRARTDGIGEIDTARALRLGMTGPCLRATGRPEDRRAGDDPAYRGLEYEPVTRTGGDALARYQVRMAEIEASAALIRELIEDLPEGEVRSEAPDAPELPEGRSYAAVESPRGELGVELVSDGSRKPVRLHFRTPSLFHLFAVEELMVGHYVADVVAILGSIDPMVGEIDR